MSATVLTPRLNHVAISVDPALLDDAGRAELLDFFGDVFGWTEGDNTGESGNPLILYTGDVRPVRVPAARRPVPRSRRRLDHFGLQVATLAELEAIVERAKAVPASTTTGCRSSTSTRAPPTGPTHDYVLTNAYIGFVLPLMIELQHLERRERPES